MSKMSHTCKDHSQAVFIRCFDGFLVTDRATGLDDGLNSCFNDFFHVIRKWEEASEARTAPSDDLWLGQWQDEQKPHGWFDLDQHQVSCGRWSR